MNRNASTRGRYLPARTIVFTVASVALWIVFVSAADAARPPNFVVIFADDLGYGDLGCYGHPTIRTPHLDRMAAEGIKFTQWYSAAEVCTPSRAALMTGRYAIRSGMCSNKRRVLFGDSKGGLPLHEITIAEVLKAKGYATACVGKWHLGHMPQFLPTKRGFDSYFGIPYSNDMKPTPLLRNEAVLEEPARQETLTARYTEESLRFIEQNRDRPFFLYLPHTFPHVPLFASAEFKGRSPRGLYGDVVEELDASVGRVLQKLRDLQLDKNTLVLFTSDNGPWLRQNLNGGSAGLLKDGKGGTWEGGMREPAIAWWPGRIAPARVSRDLVSTLDIFATLHSLAAVPLPTDRPLDSFDLSPVLFATGPSARESFFYYRGFRLMAVRKGPWKAHFMTQASTAAADNTLEQHDPPLLYNLDVDPSESQNVAEQNPQIVAELKQTAAEHSRTVIAGPPQLDD